MKNVGEISRKDDGRKKLNRTSSVDSSSKIKKGNKKSDKLQLLDLQQVEEAAPNSDLNDPDHGDHDDTSSRPAKRILELILDILQRRDAYELFAEPVDPDAVEDYYEIIKYPMDFGTMRAKLHEDMYQSLGQFEQDVYLIFKNAMHFNSSATTYFKQARALDDMAKKVFHVLKTDPEKFELEFSTTKRRSTRKICSEDNKDSNLGSCSKLPNNKRTNGERKDIDTREGRATYKPWTSLLMSVDVPEHPVLTTKHVGSTPLVQVNQQELGYKESLMEFVKDLGPTAKRVAQRKMQQSQGTKHNDQNVINIDPDNNKETRDATRTHSTKRSTKTACKIMNKKIVLALAAPRTRGGNGYAYRSPRLPRIGKPPKPNDANIVKKASKKLKIDEPNKNCSHVNDHMDQNQVKGGSIESSWQLNRLDLNEAAPLSGSSASVKGFGPGMATSTMNSTTFGPGLATNMISSSSSSSIGRELHFDTTYLRSNSLNGNRHMQSSGLGMGQSYMQMQLGAFNFSWPNCMPNSNFGMHKYHQG